MKRAGVKPNHRVNKAGIRHERREGGPVYNAEAFREVANSGGIVKQLLHRTP